MNSPYVLIDTSAWIHALRPMGSSQIKMKVEILLNEDRIATTGIVMLELLRGARTRREYKELYEDLQSLHYIPVNEDIWEGSYRLSLKAKESGLSIPSTDLLISAVAIYSGCVVMHQDKHFSLLAKKGLLKVV